MTLFSSSDEAHTIKNRGTKSAKACFELEGNHRLCLTGTPMYVPYFAGPPRLAEFCYSQNKVDEFFSLVHFLRVKPLNDWGVFKSQIADPLKKGRVKAPMKRLHVLLAFRTLQAISHTQFLFCRPFCGLSCCEGQKTTPSMGSR